MSPHPRPEEPQALLEAAIQAHLGGQFEAAERLYRAVLERRPDDADAHNNLGHLLAQRGQADRALGHHRAAARAAPGHALVQNNLGAALLQTGAAALLDEAIAALRSACALDPGSFMARNNLGTALRRAGRIEESLHCYREALRLKPDHASAWNNLGLVLADLGRPSEALQHFDRAIQHLPGFAEAHANRAGPLLELGALDDAIAAYESALALEPRLLAAHTGLLHALHYSERHDGAFIYQKARRFAAALCDGLPRLPLGNDPDPERPLRVGYVSPDLRQHAVAAFFEPLLCAHDRGRFSIWCYADVPRPDAVTARLRARADRWVDATGLSDAALAQRVQEDRIDVLVDLAGHTRGGRLLCFARRPAPVQVTYLGYPGTTGLSTMDARFTDDIADPEGLEAGEAGRYSERLWRLGGGFLCYGPPADAPPVTPRDERGAFTFASFNNRPKITPPVLRAWAQVLEGVPGSRLLLKSAGLGDALGRARLLEALAALGVAPERVTLLGLLRDPREHLGRYGEVDIALDTFPYNGTTTTCEALWMGVPVVTLRGREHAGRVGASILERVGLGDLVADTEEDYVQAAVTLALPESAQRRAELRAGLRTRLLSSPLCDGQRLAREVEAAYRELWRAFCVTRSG